MMLVTIVFYIKVGFYSNKNMSQINIDMQLSEVESYNHLWDILQDLHDESFDYGKSETLLNDDAIKLLISSLKYADNIDDSINATRLCMWFVDTDELTHCLLKFIEFNGMKNFSYSLGMQIIHLNKMKNDSDYKQYSKDVKWSIITFLKIALLTNKHNYFVATDSTTIKYIAIILKYFIIKDRVYDLPQVFHLTWMLIGSVMGLLDNNSNQYESNKKKLIWSELLFFEGCLPLLWQKYYDKIPLFTSSNVIGTVLYGLWHNRCVLCNKNVNIRLFLLTLNILTLNIKINNWENVKILLGLIYCVIRREGSLYWNMTECENDMSDNEIPGRYESIKQSNIYPFTDNILKVIIETFKDKNCLNTSFAV
eukprot:293491_1